MSEPLENDDDLLDSLEESYKLAEDEEYMYDMYDMEDVWKHGYNAALSKIIVILVSLTIANLIAFATIITFMVILWTK